MTNSKKIAGIVGPTLMAINISEALNLHIWATNIPQIVYLNGLILFVAGLSIIRFHNSWKGWGSVLTLTGWFLLAFGLFRMFFPDVEQGKVSVVTYLIIGLIFITGSFLTFKAYTGKDEKNTAD
jgi:hypothetical protein